MVFYFSSLKFVSREMIFSYFRNHPCSTLQRLVVLSLFVSTRGEIARHGFQKSCNLKQGKSFDYDIMYWHFKSSVTINGARVMWPTNVKTNHIKTKLFIPVMCCVCVLFSSLTPQKINTCFKILNKNKNVKQKPNATTKFFF